MPRDRRRMDYLRDRAERRSRRGGRDRVRDRERDRGYYPMYDYEYDRESGRGRDNARRGRDRDYRDEDYADYDYDMRGDYARRGVGRPREYNRRDREDRGDYRDYADEDMDEEYKEDLKEWIQKLKKKDRFGQSKDQVIQKAKEMKVNFDDFSEEEFYAIYLMQVSDYPSVSNDPRMYLGMAKAWLEDDDIAVDPSEKVCKYLYEIVLNEE